MDYTKNHHLPQWIKSDRIMMDDFNQMCKDLEASLNANAQAAASAQSSANSAQSTANTARQEAAAKPYAVGTYTGTGENLTVNLGFRPSFLLISGMKEEPSQDSVSQFGVYGCATTGNGSVSSSVTFTSSGFTVLKKTKLPNLSSSGRVYEYIAFK